MFRRERPLRSRVKRAVVATLALYAVALVVWTRIVTPRRVAALPPETRMRLLRWDDRLRLPAIVAVVPPAFVAAFGVYLPLATAVHEAWLAVVRRGKRLRRSDD